MPLSKGIHKVLVIGSGPIVIGQAAEFDYAGAQACLALKEEGIKVVLLNNNPATIMTDEEIAERVYIEPMTIEVVEEIIKIEKPDGIIGTLGGQTGLNLTVELAESHILEKYNVKILGTSVETIKKGEDRERFRELMLAIQEPVPESRIVHTKEEGIEFATQIGYPLIIRPAYTLGGAGGGFAENHAELIEVLNKGLSLSPIHQVLVEKSIKGWKEIEYEVVRDENNTCIIVCNMENIDPVGVHTGDSIVVAPSQTLSDVQYQLLRNASIKVIRELGVIGGCNIQFALDPLSNQYYMIEVNPRVSRSSALASKATGYPIARIATKCAIGYHLDELINPITGNTFASFEPALDYVIVKLPRFPFDKFQEADRKLSTQMKATGETMAIDRSFEGALNKGLRSMEYSTSGLTHPKINGQPIDTLHEHMKNATDLRLFAIAEALRKGEPVGKIQELTQIDLWFLKKIQGMISCELEIKKYTLHSISLNLLKRAKRMNYSDKRISELLDCSESEIRAKRKEIKLMPSYKLVDTCAGEFEAVTPYYYSTWHGYDEVEVSNNRKKALIIGSGPIRIGQGIEFDYCSVHAVLALKKQGYETIVINNNPETVSTDYSIADKLYFEPITTEDILHVIEKENVNSVFIQYGGQTPLNIAKDLKREGVHLMGTPLETIHSLEDREEFYALLNTLNIPHIQGEIAHSIEKVKISVEHLGYPVLIRPSFVIGGQSMVIITTPEELDQYLVDKNFHDKAWPLLIDQFIPGLECELDCISDGVNIFIPGIFEHIEKAGIHSGDSKSVFPPITITQEQQSLLVDYAKKICKEAGVCGIANIQFIIEKDKIYVIEVNPRASRTVPIISKVTGIPLIEWSVNAQLGLDLQNTGIAPNPALTAIKAPIFSFAKLPGVNAQLGPEMKSTGEVLGIGDSYEQALLKIEGKIASNEIPQSPIKALNDYDRFFVNL